MDEIRRCLSRCEAASLPMLERELAADSGELLAGLRALVDVGRVEELAPVYIQHQPTKGRSAQMRELRFYRLLRDTDSSCERENGCGEDST
jgi:hypothetical protein